MDPILLAVLSAAAGTTAGAIATAFAQPVADLIKKTLTGLRALAPPAQDLPVGPVKLLSGHAGHNIVGTWNSWWGETPEEIKKFHEVIVIERQEGTLVFGKATRDEEPHKVWDLEGRYDGHNLQLMYYPSPTAPDQNFSDYGCYYFVRRRSGAMRGLSIGCGPGKDDRFESDDVTIAEYCLIEPIPAASR